MNDHNLRQQLAETRRKITQAQSLLESLKHREQTLLFQIEPRVERCQRCLGRGKRVERDPWSGYDVDEKCWACNGTGQWKEPV